MRQFLRRKFVQDTLTLQIGKVGVTGFSLLSSILVVRLLGTESYGTWTLAQSFLSVWQSFNLTGVNQSTSTRLAMADGAGDAGEILNLLGFYTQVSALWSLALTGLMVVLGPAVARAAYDGETRIGWLAAWLSLTVIADALYGLVTISLQSHRSMRALAVLQNLNQATLVVCVLAGLLISPTPEGMVLARLAYSYSTMLIAFGFYWRLREGAAAYPPLRAIFARARNVSPRPYWRFGVLNALDKNLAALYTDVPLQLVGILAGTTAAGYLGLGLRAMTLPAMFTSAVFDNLQAAVPQAVGRGDYSALWRNFLRVLGVLALAAVVFYAVFALLTPLIVPLIYGGAWTVAVPVVVALSVYGAITTVGGIFGPLYRALNLLGVILAAKTLTLVILAVPGLALVETSGATGGAWLVNGLFALSLVLTALLTLPALKRRAEGQTTTI